MCELRGHFVKSETTIISYTKDRTKYLAINYRDIFSCVINQTIEPIAPD